MKKYISLLVLALAALAAANDTTHHVSNETHQKLMSLSEQVRNPSAKAMIKLVVECAFYLPVGDENPEIGPEKAVEAYLGAVQKIDTSAASDEFKHAFRNYVDATQKAGRQVSAVGAGEQNKMFGLLIRSSRGWNFSPSEEQEIKEKFNTLADLVLAMRSLDEAVHHALDHAGSQSDDDRKLMTQICAPLPEFSSANGKTEDGVPK